MTTLPEIKSLFEHAACGLVLTEINGQILRVNATFCEWTGYSRAELKEKKFQQLLKVGSRVFHHTHWVPLLQMQGSVSEIQMELLHKDGTPVTMLVNAKRRSHENQLFDEIAVVVATDRKKYEKELLGARQSAEEALMRLQQTQKKLETLNQQLSLADKRKDEFIATLSHELRNPLAPMRNTLELLKVNALDEGEIADAYSVLDRQLQQMAHLLEDLMDISRINHGRVVLRKTNVDFSSIVSDAVRMIKSQIDANQHTLTIHLPDKPVYMRGDSTRLTQIVLNLLSNAAKYTPAGGNIALAVTSDGETALLSVKDSGIGIESHQLAQVFDIFTQVDSALPHAQGGLGIGLSLVKAFVNLHHGSIEVQSAGKHQGSEFIVTLPVEGAAKHSSPAAPPQEKASSKKIIIIDDNQDAADTMARLLRALGHSTATAYTGETGIQALESQAFEIILLDIGLPDMDGYSVAKTLRNLDNARTSTIIAVTGWGQQDDIEKAKRAGFDAHLTKPVELKKLKALIEKV